MAGQLQFVKVGKVEMATVRIISGCRMGLPTRSCVVGEIVQVPADQAWGAIGAGQAVPYDKPLPGVEHVEEVPLAMPTVKAEPPEASEPEPAEAPAVEPEPEEIEPDKAPGKRRKDRR